MSRLIWVIHGPNLNLLGMREPGIYGSTSLAGIDGELAKVAKAHGVRLDSFQSNHEGALVDRVQSAPAAGVDFIEIGRAHVLTPVTCKSRITSSYCNIKNYYYLLKSN